MGESIGKYELLGQLGTRGSDTVYRARDARMGRTVAIRVLGDAARNPAARSRFVDAARAFEQLSHPHVATLFDVGEDREHLYLVYEFVPGERLSDLAAGRPLNLRRAVDVCTQVAAALAEAHACGLQHGGLTLSSIVVTPKGHVKVLDFGLPAWSRPLGDARDDIFALGAILYHLLTGRPPFESTSLSEMAVLAAQSTAPPPSSFTADIPVALDAIVARAMARNPKDRYDHAATLAADLRSALSSVLEHDARHEMTRVMESGPRHAGLWRLLFLLVLLASALAVTGWTLRERAAGMWAAQFGPTPPPIIAVVPFATGATDGSRESAGPGMAEEIALRLGHLHGVTLKGSASMRSFSGRPLVAIAAETGASMVVSGSVGPGPDGWSTIYVTVVLVNGRDGRALWSHRYEGPDTEVVAIQARIASDLAARLGLAGPPSASNARAALRLTNPEAYDTYLQGLDARAAGDLGRASRLFQAAVDEDPGLVEAQAALVQALYATVAFDSSAPDTAVFQRIRRIAEEAATADPDLAPAQLAMGLAADNLHDAFQHLRRAIELNPSLPQAYLAAADVIRDVDPARSTRFARKAAELDSRLVAAIYQEAAAALSTGSRQSVLPIVARGQAFAPSLPAWDALRQRILLTEPNREHRVTATRSVSDFAPGSLIRALAFLEEGRPAEAVNLLGIVTRMNPAFCEAGAILAGINLQSGSLVEASRQAREILAAARAATDQAPLVRCAALAAASMRDADEAAFWVQRAATDPRALRMWGATSAVLSPLPAIRQHLFPWSNLVTSTRFGHAVASLESAVVRARVDAAKTFNGLEGNQQ
jgi:TolB-like protein